MYVDGVVQDMEKSQKIVFEPNSVSIWTNHQSLLDRTQWKITRDEKTPGRGDE
jgi:hypothetical protein